MISVVEATQGHMAELAGRMRQRDRDEIERFGWTVETSVRVTWARSLLTRTVLVDGMVAAVGGCGGSPLGGIGQPWMLTTSTFERIPKFMVEEGRRQIQTWLSVFARLENVVDAEYGRACRYLAALGFTLDEPRPFASGIEVRRFWMER